MIGTIVSVVLGVFVASLSFVVLPVCFVSILWPRIEDEPKRTERDL